MRGPMTEARGLNRALRLRPGSIAKSLRILLAGVFLLSMLAGIAPHQARADGSSYVATDELNLRTGPGTDYDVMDHMFSGDSISVVDGPTDGGWYKIDYYGEIGWAYGPYLAIDGVLGAQADSVGSSSSQTAEHWIDVDRSSHIVTLYIGDEAVNTYYASLGYDQSESGFYATATGTYYVWSKYKALSWTDFGQAYIKDWVGFDRDRDNGFHSYSMNSKGKVLANGDGPTGGCVATAPADALAIYNFAYIGMRVEVHW